MNTPLNKNVFYLGNPRKLYTGLLPAPLIAELAAPLLCVSLDDDLTVTDLDTQTQLKTKSVLTSSCTNVSLDLGRSPVFLVVLDYLGVDYQIFEALGQEQHISAKGNPFFTELAHADELIALGKFLWRTQPASTQAFELVEGWVQSLDRSHVKAPDPRVQQAVDFIEHHRNSDLSIEEISNHVGLSVPRLSQLFKQTTGVATRRLKLWIKAHAVANYIGQGHNLTDATRIAGFSDYSHFSRTFKEISGLNPSILFSANAKVELQNKESFPLKTPKLKVGNR